MQKKVLILGKTGMLGSMVFHYLRNRSDLDVYATTRRSEHENKDFYFETDSFLNNQEKYQYLLNFDYIINCIGIIKPYCKDTDLEGVKRAIINNALLPHKINEYCKKKGVKIIQIATDCVFSGKEGNYKEDSAHDATDVYGKTKSLGEVRDKNFLNIRCSVIGPELFNKSSLLEWFLAHKEGSELIGYSHHKWNGVTSLQFAKLCLSIIKGNYFNKLSQISYIHHFVPNNIVNKYELLILFKDVFGRKYKIKKVDNIGQPIDRTLSTKFNLLGSIFKGTDIKQSLVELRDYMYRYKLSIYNK